MSFDIYGGFIADGVLRDAGAVREQRELVVEGIIRHQDLGEVGTQTRLGGLVQLATVFDNMGDNAQLVHEGTIENVVREWPRLGWSMYYLFSYASFLLSLGRIVGCLMRVGDMGSHVGK